MLRQPLDDRVKIERTALTLRIKVLNALRGAILNFQLLPGDRLVERDLCDLLGVSRTSIREALRHLESEGLVEYLEGKGPRVAVMTSDSAREIYELRCALECMVVELFTLNASEEQVLDLEYALGKLKARLKEGEITAILEMVNHFYEVLYEGCGNKITANLLRQQQARVNYLRATSLSRKKRSRDSDTEMTRIVAAIKSRDVNKAHTACLNHIKKAAEVALKVITEQQKDGEEIQTDIYSVQRVEFPERT
ncbi:GntR family transcriptional regulator [Endozoicomonas gorgoniicola]|uniref:GntR family transcriptional regulator n=1 Tax=Endozoicomonas gorgoniicola TaxID=1234144 RepID=A0ABT3MU86_9GAMM|nr:GntR family transcriptional regulator [Endozoicomonas gorgoniicola]MCW7552933.1 GntR family transcriptional regulator [Endozoicomonas gorgoniicola]